MSTLLRGAPVAERLTLDLSRRSAALRHRGVIPTLAILRVGSSPGDLAYEKSAAARCARCGIEVRHLTWENAGALPDAIRAVNADPSIHGCLLLRPLCMTGLCWLLPGRGLRLWSLILAGGLTLHGQVLVRRLRGGDLLWYVLAILLGIAYLLLTVRAPSAGPFADPSAPAMAAIPF